VGEVSGLKRRRRTAERGDERRLVTEKSRFALNEPLARRDVVTDGAVVDPGWITLSR
jgi:hypothetical protein